MVKKRNLKLHESGPVYYEDPYLDSEEDALYESASESMVYYEDPYLDDARFDEVNFESDDFTSLNEDLDSSYPATRMTEAEVRSAAAKVRKGAIVQFGYVKNEPLNSHYAKGDYVKKEKKQYPVVKAIKVATLLGCTGVHYKNTAGAKLLHSTQDYQDKLAARLAAGQGGFGTNVHDSEERLEDVLVTTSHGKKCLLVYPITNEHAKCEYYISIDGEDWRKTTKDEIALYMNDAVARDFLHPELQAAKRAYNQVRISNNADQNAMPVEVGSEMWVVDANTRKRIKVNTSPINMTYFNPESPWECVFQIHKESAITPVFDPNSAGADIDDTSNSSVVNDDPLGQDFPDVDASGNVLVDDAPLQEANSLPFHG